MSEETLARAMGALEAGAPSEADAIARAAIADARATHGPESAELAAAEFEHAHLLSAVGDVAGAAEAMRRSAAIAPRDDADRRARLTVLLNLGEALLHLERLDEAERVITEGVLERRELYGPDHPGYGFGLEPLVELLLARGRADEARAAAKEALALFWRHGHGRVVSAVVLYAFATKAAGAEPGLERLYALPKELVVEVVIGCLDRAAKATPEVALRVLDELFERGLHAREEEPWLMHVAAHVSRVARRAGAHGPRRRALAWLVEHFDGVDDGRQSLDAVLARALAEAEAGEAELAERSYLDALARAERLGDLLAVSRVLRNLGVYLMERGRAEEARARLRDALARAEAADPDDPQREPTIASAAAALAAH